MPNGTQSRGSATVVVACLSAGMALTMATGVALMTRHPADSARAPVAAAEQATRDARPSARAVVPVRPQHSGPAVTTAFPHTTEMPTPRRVAVRPRHRVAQEHTQAPAPRVHHVRVHRVTRHENAPAPRPHTWTPRPRTSCDGGHGGRHWHHWRHGPDHWQGSRDACRHD